MLLCFRYLKGCVFVYHLSLGKLPPTRFSGQILPTENDGQKLFEALILAEDSQILDVMNSIEGP
jgi:hypothetical protein